MLSIKQSAQSAALGSQATDPNRVQPARKDHRLQATLSTRILACMLSVVLGLCLIAPASASADVRKADLIVGESVQSRGLAVSQCPNISAQHAIVLDADGTVYFERDADTSACIASITKIMTAVTALDLVPLDTKISVSDTAAEIGESSAALQSGDTMTLQEALKAMLLPSGNDGAEAIGESVGALILQSEGKDSSDTQACVTRFVQAMNDKSAELGMTGSVWRNPHGLDDGNYAGDQHSCARDVGTLAVYAMKKQAIRDITNQESGTCTVTRGGQTVSLALTSTDELLGVYNGACGIKTGFTDKAGACFAGACNRDGKDLYAIVLDSSDEAQRFTDAETLWDWVYNHMVNYTLCNTPQTTVDASTGATVPLVASVADGAWTDKTVDATLQDSKQTVGVFSLSGNVSQTVEYKDLSGDVKAGDVVGTITFKQRNDVVATADLIATENVPGPGIIDGIGIWWNKFISGFSGSKASADSVLYNTTPLINDKSA
jgi:D-alanyl-D-alanine carboxypeptidase (penicillin-binding protein 5/6)